MKNVVKQFVGREILDGKVFSTLACEGQDAVGYTNYPWRLPPTECYDDEPLPLRDFWTHEECECVQSLHYAARWYDAPATASVLVASV